MLSIRALLLRKIPCKGQIQSRNYASGNGIDGATNFLNKYGGIMTTIMTGAVIIYTVGGEVREFKQRLNKYDESINKLDVTISKLEKLLDGERDQRNVAMVRAFANIRYLDSRVIQLQKWSGKEFNEEDLYNLALKEADEPFNPKNRWYELEKVRKAHLCEK